MSTCTDLLVMLKLLCIYVILWKCFSIGQGMDVDVTAIHINGVLGVFGL